MTHDPLVAELFLEAIGEAKRNAQSLSSSLRRLAGVLPFSARSLASMDDDAKDRVDAFCLRFLKLQDTLGKPVFRSLLALELEDPENLSQLDILNKMEKRGIVESVERWVFIRQIRNMVTHDYPEAPEKRVEALNKAIEFSGDLLATLGKVEAYVTTHTGVNVMPRSNQ